MKQLAASVLLLLAPEFLYGQSVLEVPGQYPTIQSAINAAQAGDTVLVAAGTYPETINFLGKAITVRSRRGPAVTTIDAGFTARVVSFENGEGLDSVLEGFTLTNGMAYASSIGYTEYGGGIRCWFCSPTIRRCRIVGNFAGTGLGPGDNGGGIAVRGGAPLVESCVIMGNLARTGGGIHAREIPAPTFLNCVIAGNTAVYDDGGINTAAGAPVSMINCTVVDNEAFYGGGVGAFGSSQLTLTNSIVWGNSPGQVNTGAQGGQVFVNHSVVQGGFPGQGNLNADPMFTGGLVPWRLRPLSPCIGAGTSAVVLPATDFEGDPRVFGGSVDIGADEYASTTTVCAVMTRPNLAGTWQHMAVLTTSPSAPILVLLDVAAGSVSLGALGSTQIALTPFVLPLADPTGFFGASWTHPFTDASGTWALTAAIPTVPDLVGSSFFIEAYVADFGAPNGYFRQSNLLTMTVE